MTGTYITGVNGNKLFTPQLSTLADIRSVCKERPPSEDADVKARFPPPLDPFQGRPGDLSLYLVLEQCDGQR
jgi:hypothetical protein